MNLKYHTLLLLKQPQNCTIQPSKKPFHKIPSEHANGSDCNSFFILKIITYRTLYLFLHCSIFKSASTKHSLLHNKSNKFVINYIAIRQTGKIFILKFLLSPLLILGKVNKFSLLGETIRHLVNWED